MNALRILVADDNVLIGTLLAELLEDLGHEVCSVETTEAGTVSAAARCRPDLVIIDAKLGTGSGFFALEQILRCGPVAHVIISGAGHQHWPPGMKVLQKPFRESDLVREMERALATVAAASFSSTGQTGSAE